MAFPRLLEPTIKWRGEGGAKISMAFTKCREIQKRDGRYHRFPGI